MVKPQDYRWYSSPDITWTRASVLALISFLLLLTVNFTFWGQIVESRLSRPFEFQVRDRLGRSPNLDPRIKIYAFGDSTLNYVGDTELPLKDWSSVFRSFAPYKPRAVIIDKVFGTPRGIEYAPEFVKELRSLRYPIIAGSFLRPSPIKDRLPLEKSRPEFDLSRLLGLEKPMPEIIKRHFSWLKAEKGVPYGPHPAILPALKEVGHLQYWDSLIPAFKPLDDLSAIPHVSFLVAHDRSFRDGKLFLDGQPAPLDRHGSLLVNFVNPSVIRKDLKALSGVLKNVRSGAPLKEVPDDAVIVILPAMFTGSTDFVDSPFGLIHGGFVVISLINSVLTGQWITTFAHGWALLLVSVLLGLFIAVRTIGISFGISFVAIPVGMILAGLASFSYLGIKVPWFSCATSFIVTSLSIFISKLTAQENRARRIREALEGVVSPSSLTRILKTPSILNLKPSGHIVSIMFIDIAGFSLTAEHQSPEDAFFALKALLGELSEIVHRYGGNIDKSTGDGMLCFFGYNIDGSPPLASHADQTLLCAIEIQRHNVSRNVQSASEGKPIYPLRIGINTAEVYIGDIGSEYKIDLTLIGNGVNFAKRLEEACDDYCIMLGKTTYEALSEARTKSLTFHKRYVKIKHYGDPIAGYECDPLMGDPELKRQAINAYRETIKLFRKDERWTLPAGVTIEIATVHGLGELVNYSVSGIAVKLDRYYGRGIVLDVYLGSPDSSLRERLTRLNLLPLVCEVRWGSVSASGHFIHGLLFKSLRRDQGTQLIDELQLYLKNQAQPKSRRRKKAA